MKTKFKNIIRIVYLYTFSAVGLIIFLVGGIMLMNVVLKTYIFPLEHYEEYYYSDNCSNMKYDYINEEYKTLTEEEESECDEERRIADSDSRKRDLALGVADIIVGTPIWLYHWGVIQRKRKEED